MELAQGTIPEFLPCPLCTSPHILPVLRCATNCDVKLKLVHCNTCGMEAPQHTWNTWARPARALKYSGGERLAPASWLDAMAERWKRRASELYKSANEGNFYIIDKTAADTWKRASKELRAEMESASNETELSHRWRRRAWLAMEGF